MTRFGILSTARINRKIIEGAAGSDSVELVAVASRDRARADDYAREWGIPRAHGSYDALLADPDVDAVYISLPNSMHCEWSIRALEAGKHVLCEKPMSSSPAEVEVVFDVAERHGLVCMEAFMWRHSPQSRRLATLVAEGAIGELRLVRSAFTYPLVDGEHTVQMRPELDGGSLMDIG
ncbi:MAG: Gfo/Idh/MocA family oxidoreductase, partial [Gaiellales bacterium]